MPSGTKILTLKAKLMGTEINSGAIASVIRRRQSHHNHGCVGKEGGRHTIDECLRTAAERLSTFEKQNETCASC